MLALLLSFYKEEKKKNIEWCGELLSKCKFWASRSSFYVTFLRSILCLVVFCGDPQSASYLSQMSFRMLLGLEGHQTKSSPVRQCLHKLALFRIDANSNIFVCPDNISLKSLAPTLIKCKRQIYSDHFLSVLQVKTFRQDRRSTNQKSGS